MRCSWCGFLLLIEVLLFEKSAPYEMQNDEAPVNAKLEATLLIGLESSIVQAVGATDGTVKQVLNITGQHAFGIDYDCKAKRIVWSDINGNVINSAFLDGTDVQEIFSDAQRQPVALVIDWSSRNVYFVNWSVRKIGVVSVDGKYTKMLTDEGVVSRQQALALDLHNRHLYFGKYSSKDPEKLAIGRIDLDGSNLIDFLDETVSIPNLLAVLPKRRELCWVDYQPSELSCISLDGQNRRLVYKSDDLRSIKDWTVHNEERFYWTSWTNGKVSSVSVTGEGNTSFGGIDAFGTVLLHGIATLTDKCPEEETECAVNKGGCPHLCLPKAGGGVTCVENEQLEAIREHRFDSLLIAKEDAIIESINTFIPRQEIRVREQAKDMVFDCENQRIVWIAQSDSAIRTSYLNGTDQKELLANTVKDVGNLAIDWSSKSLYFTEWISRDILATNFDGKYTVTIVSGRMGIPHGMVVDLQNRHLYFSHHQIPLRHATIERVDLDGSNRIEFTDTNTSYVKGLVIVNKTRELCWIESNIENLPQSKISCFGLDNKNRRTIPIGSDSSTNVYDDLTVVNDFRFFYTDSNNSTIDSVTVEGEWRFELKLKIGSGMVNSITTASERCYGTATECAVNNGGCPYLCLPRAGGGVTCACPENIEELAGCEYGF